MVATLLQEATTSTKRWAKLYDCCIVCGGTDRKHKGHGRCTRCHDSNNYRKNPERWRSRARQWAAENNERVRANVAAWQSKNGSKVKAYKTKSQQRRRAGEPRADLGLPPLIFKGMQVLWKAMKWTLTVWSRPRQLDGEWVIDAKHHERLHKDIPLNALEVVR